MSKVMTNPYLSICIATYNRAEYIGETLKSIITQVTDEVEIVIVDGASTDDTSRVVNSYMEVCKQINYIKLPAKGGVDQDYCVAVEHAQGEMCWLFPDDDLLKPEAINTVLEEVKKKYSLIIVNSQVMSRDFSKILECKRLKINTNEVYDKSKFEQLFNRVVECISFIGCVVVNRDLWIQREKKVYYGTEFIHVGVIFQAPLPGPALVIAEPYIAIRYGNAQWTPRAFEIWMFKWPNLLYSFVHISEKVRKEHQMTNLWLRLRFIIMSRARGEFSLKKYLKYFTSKDLSIWWRIIVLFISIMPCFFVNFIMLTYIKIVNKEALMTIYNLENNRFNIINMFKKDAPEEQKEKICI